MRPDHQSPLFGLRIPRGGLHASRPAHAHGSIENEKKSVKNRNRQRVREAVSHGSDRGVHFRRRRGRGWQLQEAGSDELLQLLGRQGVRLGLVGRRCFAGSLVAGHDP